jgi:hypothetical protein
MMARGREPVDSCPGEWNGRRGLSPHAKPVIAAGNIPLPIAAVSAMGRET